MLKINRRFVDKYSFFVYNKATDTCGEGGAFMIAALIFTVGLGILICVIGVLNMLGNISSVHWYHKQRVSPDDIKPFGRLVGAGTFIIGVSCIAFGIASFVFEKTQTSPVLIAGTAILIGGVIAGFALTFYAMIKYNKGIF